MIVVCIWIKKREILFSQIATVENIPGYKYALKGKRQDIKITAVIGRLDDRLFFSSWF